ncbi:hypothetical protein [Micromonospora sp. IBHARD004]|uniref:hypothetical protein n=1 Tax=Micromonospora sp. IBHARD004 TaxID=3457764 RepID=UPI0040584702
MGCDLDLRVLCVRGTVTTWSKCSCLACDLCRQISERVGRRYGARSALPLGRHSIMNGDLVRMEGWATQTSAPKWTR